MVELQKTLKMIPNSDRFPGNLRSKIQFQAFAWALRQVGAPRGRSTGALLQVNHKPQTTNTSGKSFLNPSQPPYCGIPDQLLYIACVCAGSIIIILFCYCYQVTISQLNVQYNKVGCVFLMVVVPMLPHAKFGRNDRGEYALHFIAYQEFIQ